MGEEKPGAEHFVLSALNLEDGTAKRAFERLGADSGKFQAAVEKQYSEALSHIGMDPPSLDIQPEPIETTKTFQESQASGQDLMKKLFALKQQDKQHPLLGAHVLCAVADMQHGVVSRAFRVMGIKPEQLIRCAREEIHGDLT
ncbi:MAG: Clp protease N-terminal domain-containing protein [Candidatus Thiodiazotropha taylori]|uniref:Clp protease N-terminal domain-containing protein n=1 Tax=Candidatus Thiodiazotropha taylori TaxID=2792791 RepID=A0A9E4N5A7_9GAMM|nr:Clp protease N-terminal domain-containing protein [Candidatus Thiodiazotropha taylori]MCG7963952.1 Clp protease N-terminal domain-containing protein [Candidatus Thiodiazotropha endolucinida]MCG7954489.1 Clp protease N-terminal domain-containing protein [Candidatus Thiodiazotropha taylori]MCG8040211.1 Clp protease N-terminal domain-containing protein [Candidatus Thiodiazotropha taylori]MCG8052030.1 Clp protease N-terminal domain-containing protein [Candidatus Thiodiazotropha taylori]